MKQNPITVFWFFRFPSSVFLPSYFWVHDDETAFFFFSPSCQNCVKIYFSAGFNVLSWMSVFRDITVFIVSEIYKLYQILSLFALSKFMAKVYVISCDEAFHQVLNGVLKCLSARPPLGFKRWKRYEALFFFFLNEAKGSTRNFSPLHSIFGIGEMCFLLKTAHFCAQFFFFALSLSLFKSFSDV